MSPIKGLAGVSREDGRGLGEVLEQVEDKDVRREEAWVAGGAAWAAAAS